MRFGEEPHNASETTVGDIVEQLGLDERDRICHLSDYGDEWRFSAILTEVIDVEADNTAPRVGETRGDGIEQYGPSR